MDGRGWPKWSGRAAQVGEALESSANGLRRATNQSRDPSKRIVAFDDIPRAIGHCPLTKLPRLNHAHGKSHQCMVPRVFLNASKCCVDRRTITLKRLEKALAIEEQQSGNIVTSVVAA